MQKEFDVALSFAGEDRSYARKLAELLKSGCYTVFYDEYEQAELWGKNLYDHLSSVYKDKAHFCVMFLSQNYAKKLWTQHERESAQARAFEESREYILPVRLDDTEIPGILSTIGYLDIRKMSIEKVYQILAQKLSGMSQMELTDAASISSGGESTKNCCRSCHFLAKYASTDGGQTLQWTWNAKERSALKVNQHYGIECAKGIWSAGIDPEIKSRLEEELLKVRRDCFFLEYDEAHKSMTFDAATELVNQKDGKSQRNQQTAKPIERVSEAAPLSTEAAVASLKRFLSDPRYRIQLADLIDETVESVIEHTSGENFDAYRPNPTTETVTARARAYEAACSTLIEIALIGGHWAKEAHCDFWQPALRRFAAVPRLGGKAAWLDMRLYPGMLLLYALGLGAVETDRLGFLGRMFSDVVHRDNNERMTVVQAFAPYQRFEPAGPMNMLEGTENYQLPLNEWMFNALRKFTKGSIPAENRYRLNFVKLEILMSMNSVYRRTQAWKGQTRGIFLYNLETAGVVLQEITDSIAERRDESLFVRADIFGLTSEDCMQRIDGLQRWISASGIRRFS